MQFKNRKEQIEKDVFRRLKRELKGCIGIELPKAATPIILDALRSAAMVGGCELRQQALDALPTTTGVIPSLVRTVITRRAVLDVLGYTEES